MSSSLDSCSEAVADVNYQIVTTRLPRSISSTADQFFLALTGTDGCECRQCRWPGEQRPSD